MVHNLAAKERPGNLTAYLEAHGTSQKTGRCPFKGSFEGDRGPYKGDIRLFCKYLKAHGT